jgi:ABC-type amino acid transport substrate-binding protein
MDREIIRAAVKRLGIKQVDFKTMTFGKLGQSLLDGKIDLIANNYWPTPDRERLYAFTLPYFVRGGVGSSSAYMRSAQAALLLHDATFPR